ncbi:MAG: IS91 family transposase [Acidobacteria bacterium]|nr:IS91 family transposase [Acidobacteriota bacterium]
MLEVADIFRRHGAAYRAQYQLLPSQARAMQDIEACRTAYFGGHLKQCDHCGRQLYAYHSCRNRHCPKCHGNQTERWLAQQQTRLLPCPYFLVTFTLPAELRPLAFANQKKVYGLMMRCAGAALQKLALDARYGGGRLGALAVLHTWTRAMLYHPHVHLLVTGGGLSADGQEWRAGKNPAFLMPEGALAIIFRAKLCTALKKAGLLAQVPRQVWKKNWVVHCKAAGQGRQVLNYLARYIFRVAISNSRLERIENGQVTFRYRDNRSQQLRRVKLTAVEFMRRFLQHTLPRGCAKVRYYGIWSPACRAQLEQAGTLLGPVTIAATTAAAGAAIAVETVPDSSLTELEVPVPAARCPHCHLGQLFEVRVLAPLRKVPP